MCLPEGDKLSIGGRQIVSQWETSCLSDGEGCLPEEDKLSNRGRQAFSHRETSCLP